MIWFQASPELALATVLALDAAEQVLVARSIKSLWNNNSLHVRHFCRAMVKINQWTLS